MARSKKPSRHERHATWVGIPPGTLTLNPESPKPIIQVIAFGPQESTERGIADVDAIPAFLKRWPVTWVNVDGLGDTETIRRLGEMFNLHPLALEDVLDVYHRPKIEQYEDHLYMVVRMLEPEMPIQTEQLSIFVGKGFVITFQEHPGDCLDVVRKRIREGRGRIRTQGADYLAYSLVDAVVDGYYPFLDELGDRVDALETIVLEKPTSDVVSTIHEFKRDLLTVRRVMSSQREAVNTLLRDTGGPISNTTRIYYRDCYDHTIHVLETVETYREVVGGLLDIYLSSVSNRTNEVMKVLTMIATIFIPLSFVAGVYGMNFDTQVSRWNMPELRWAYGYPAFLLLVIAIVVVQISFFLRRGWLGRGDGKRKRPTNNKAGQ